MFRRSRLQRGGGLGKVQEVDEWETHMDLTGQLLIAMPGMGDARFDRSVVLICSYSDEGAMGLILNKPMPNMTMRDVFERLEMTVTSGPADVQVHIGGPVQTERGFFLHCDGTRTTGEPMTIPGGYMLSATQGVLRDTGLGDGPDPFVFALGYSGWGPGQLDHEISQNGWLTAPARADLVFAGDDDALWEAALRSIGINPVSLSSAAGRA